MSAPIRNLLILTAVLLVVGIFYPILKRNYNDFTDYIEQERIYKAYGDSVLVFPFVSYKSTGVVQFRLNRDKHTVSYNCMVSADSGYSLNDNTSDALTIELNDKFAFLIDKVVLSKKTNIADSNDYVCSYIYRGECDIPPKQFAKIKSINVFNSLTFLRKANPEELTELKPLKKRTTKIKPPVVAPPRQEEMAIWNKKAERIRVGMSYQEMLDNAGEPRYTERCTSSEHIADHYDEVKYNYGTKWVYLRGKRVAMIK